MSLIDDQFGALDVIIDAISAVIYVFDHVYFLGYSWLSWIAAICCFSLLVEIAIRLVQPVRVGTGIRAFQRVGDWQNSYQDSRRRELYRDQRDYDRAMRRLDRTYGVKRDMDRVGLNRNLSARPPSYRNRRRP